MEFPQQQTLKNLMKGDFFFVLIIRTVETRRFRETSINNFDTKECNL